MTFFVIEAISMPKVAMPDPPSRMAIARAAGPIGA